MIKTISTTIFSNAFLLLIPIFIWNILFWRKLPPEFEEKRFDAGVSKTLLIFEQIFRCIIFGLPLFMRIDYSQLYQNPGFHLYITGTAVYFFSWLVLIKFPQYRWSRSLPGFCAPAYTTIFWLTGIAIFADQSYLPIPYSIWSYLLPSIIFVIIHTIHAIIAFNVSRK